ncbi:MAG TPA: hypothetical protein VK541_05380 [Pedobacter sp.]|uniref:hypothetical protein n=1 Tax=Pedobacter sp. TaxID=1411316 RepID=UPI002C4578B1|nr:hypothetical protein [Pedobacter sp.]HMI01891.1 hypothetical protein [Pedobacter sp.]
MNEEPKHIQGNNGESGHVEGPAGGHVDFEGVEKSSLLYPLDQHSERSGSDSGFQVEDLGLNSDGTNPGTEYEASGIEEPEEDLPAHTDLDENGPERDLLDDERDGYA